MLTSGFYASPAPQCTFWKPVIRLKWLMVWCSWLCAHRLYLKFLNTSEFLRRKVCPPVVYLLSPFPCLQQAEDSGVCFTCRNGISTPYSKGSITFTVVASDRPGFTDYYSNPTMQQFVQASRVRVRFQGHFHVSNIRHEYFALYELRVSGRWGKLQGRIPMEDFFFLLFFLGGKGCVWNKNNLKLVFIDLSIDFIDCFGYNFFIFFVIVGCFGSLHRVWLSPGCVLKWLYWHLSLSKALWIQSICL